MIRIIQIPFGRKLFIFSVLTSLILHAFPAIVFGATIENGDAVFLRTNRGLYLNTDNVPLAPAKVKSTRELDPKKSNEVWWIERPNGKSGTINYGEGVFLRTNRNNYLNTDNTPLAAVKVKDDASPHASNSNEIWWIEKAGSDDRTKIHAERTRPNIVETTKTTSFGSGRKMTTSASISRNGLLEMNTWSDTVNVTRGLSGHHVFVICYDQHGNAIWVSKAYKCKTIGGTGDLLTKSNDHDKHLEKFPDVIGKHTFSLKISHHSGSAKSARDIIVGSTKEAVEIHNEVKAELDRLED